MNTRMNANKNKLVAIAGPISDPDNDPQMEWINWYLKKAAEAEAAGHPGHAAMDRAMAARIERTGTTDAANVAPHVEE